MLTKPNIFVSKCLGFAKCRWNGDIIPGGGTFLTKWTKFFGLA